MQQLTGNNSLAVEQLTGNNSWMLFLQAMVDAELDLLDAIVSSGTCCSALLDAIVSSGTRCSALLDAIVPSGTGCSALLDAIVPSGTGCAGRSYLPPITVACGNAS